MKQQVRFAQVLMAKRPELKPWFNAHPPHLPIIPTWHTYRQELWSILV